MKIKLLRASTTAKEVEFAATMPPLDIQRLSVDLMFENFERNETHLWPRQDDTRGARHQISSHRRRRKPAEDIRHSRYHEGVGTQISGPKSRHHGLKAKGK